MKKYSVFIIAMVMLTTTTLFYTKDTSKDMDDVMERCIKTCEQVLSLSK